MLGFGGGGGVERVSVSHCVGGTTPVQAGCFCLGLSNGHVEQWYHMMLVTGLSAMIHCSGHASVQPSAYGSTGEPLCRAVHRTLAVT